MNANSIIQTLKDQNIAFVDLRFCDTLGKEHHLTIPVSCVEEDLFEDGKMFDGSSIAGWKGINESDMVLMPDPKTAFADPFSEHSTLIIRCNVLEPNTMQGYARDPRSLALRAEAYLNQSGIADQAFFGPEPEFFIFEGVNWSTHPQDMRYSIYSREGLLESGHEAKGNLGHRPTAKGGYAPVTPIDSLNDIRGTMCQVLEEIGVPVEVHHHEVAAPGQCEIGTVFNSLVRKADEMLMTKYVVHNVAHDYGCTATFMPKPVVGDNGSGMHIHQSLSKNGENLFSGDRYGGLSETALHYIGGVFKHAKALNAFANSTTNSYKRLVPGFEAPVMLAYSARNRSALVRIPFVNNPKGRRIEIRFGDAAGNPYLTFAAMMMAGLDGIKNRIDPGSAMDKDLYDLPPEEAKGIPSVCHSLDQALEALDNDREFLKAGGVFSDDMIDGYIALKMEEVTRLRVSTHPVEFEMYYSS